MLPNRFLPIVAILLGFTFSTLCADESGILLRVEQHNTSDMNAKDRFSRTQKHALMVYLTNSLPNPADLKVKYTYFGRDLSSHDVVVINSGEQQVAVKPHGEASVDLGSATSTSTDEHYQAGGKGKAATKIPAAGAKFVGYAVQVYAGSTLAAETYEPLSMKEEVGKAQPEKAGTPAAAKPATKPGATPAKKG
ncbi:MAG TPA: hypothetical protein VGM54_05505 [Chthoniobacter sp.]|jgi:hypothetical protein